MSDASPFSNSTPAWLERVVEAVKQRERLLLILGVGLQMAVLCSLLVIRTRPLITGDTVLLRVVPVDPRDMFRGDYVTLSYSISRIPPGGIQGLPAGSNQKSQTVYVSLIPEADGVHWTGGNASIYQPTQGKYIRGELQGGSRIVFGLESYYVQQGTGLEYEQAARTRKLSAEVAIAADGQAALRGLKIEPAQR